MQSQLPHQFSQLSTTISESQARDQRIVIMTCGIAGSGKSTLAKLLVKTYPNFTRLSIDSWIYTRYGAVGSDFPAALNETYQDEAEAALKVEFEGLLRDGKRDVVLDFSFWGREFRDEWRDIIRFVEEGRMMGDPGVRVGEGIRTVLVVFEVGEEVLWRRIEGRRLMRESGDGDKDGDSVAVIGRELLREYVKGFERPGEDEGEIIVLKD